MPGSYKHAPAPATGSGALSTAAPSSHHVDAGVVAHRCCSRAARATARVPAHRRPRRCTRLLLDAFSSSRGVDAVVTAFVLAASRPPVSAPSDDRPPPMRSVRAVATSRCVAACRSIPAFVAARAWRHLGIRGRARLRQQLEMHDVGLALSWCWGPARLRVTRRQRGLTSWAVIVLAAADRRHGLIEDELARDSGRRDRGDPSHRRVHWHQDADRAW